MTIRSDDRGTRIDTEAQAAMPARTGRPRVLVIGLVIAALVAGTVGVRAMRRPGPASSTTPAAQPQREEPAAVLVVAAARADMITHVPATGTVTALRESKLASKISGRVAVVLVREGDQVRPGQALLRLDTSDLVAQEAAARADLRGARARLEQLLAGARPEERRMAADHAAQAAAAMEAARARLRALEIGARPQEREEIANAVAQAKTTLEWAQLDYNRIRDLYQQGAVSKAQLDFAEVQLRQAQAAYDTARQRQSLVNEGPRAEEIQAARAAVAQAGAAHDAAQQQLRLVNLGPRSEEIEAARALVARAEAALAAARLRIQDATLTAPFAGTIVQRMVEPGESASPTSPAFLLAQLDQVIVELSVVEKYRTQLRAGQPVIVTVDALPGATFQGTVAEIRPAASVTTRSFTAKVTVRNLEGALRPGMFARGAITVAVRPGVLRVPEKAVVVTAGQPVVFIVRDARAVRREVSAGERAGGFVEITAGVVDGDQVVVEGQEGLTDHRPVTLRAPR